jgi:hypothetical protein
LGTKCEFPQGLKPNGFVRLTARLKAAPLQDFLPAPPDLVNNPRGVAVAFFNTTHCQGRNLSPCAKMLASKITIATMTTIATRVPPRSLLQNIENKWQEKLAPRKI